jgi:hypothetical protein
MKTEEADGNRGALAKADTRNTRSYRGLNRPVAGNASLIVTGYQPPLADGARLCHERAVGLLVGTDPQGPEKKKP